MTNSTPLRLVLVGGGHAHVHLLHEMAKAPFPGTEVVLISPYPHHHYSGMVPGYLAGRYEAHEFRFDLERAVGAVGGRLVVGWATRIELHDPRDPMSAGRVWVGDQAIDFDLASLDVGSVPLGMDLPGAAELAGTVRPMSRAVALRERLDALISDAPQGSEVPVAVIGAGSAGFEVALALHRRIQLQGRMPRVLLVERGVRILPDFSDEVRRRAEGILAGVGIELRLGTTVRALHPDGVELEGRSAGRASRWATQLPVWMTGAAPPPFLALSDLPTTPADGRAGAPGFFLVDETLRSVGGAPVWGAGDCISLEGAPWMGRAGVYAVRQSPVLEANLRGEVRRRQGLPALAPRPFRPQRSFLSLQNTADGRALLRWKGVVLHTRWAMTLKDRIDRAFMTKYTSS